MTLLSDKLSVVARDVNTITEFIRHCQVNDLTDADRAALKALVKELGALVSARPVLNTPSSKVDPD